MLQVEVCESLMESDGVWKCSRKQSPKSVWFQHDHTIIQACPKNPAIGWGQKSMLSLGWKRIKDVERLQQSGKTHLGSQERNLNRVMHRFQAKTRSTCHPGDRWEIFACWGPPSTQQTINEFQPSLTVWLADLIVSLAMPPAQRGIHMHSKARWGSNNVNSALTDRSNCAAMKPFFGLDCESRKIT